MKVIILEGPDGSGKSTLADSIEKLLVAAGDVVTRWHYGPHDPDKTSIQEYLEPLKAWTIEHADDENETLLIDRFHIGEMIYGPVLRGSSRMNNDERQAIDDFLETIGAYKFYVRPSRSVILARFDSRGDDLVKREQLSDIIQRYDWTLSASTRGWITVGDDLAELIHHFAGRDFQ